MYDVIQLNQQHSHVGSILETLTVKPINEHCVDTVPYHEDKIYLEAVFSDGKQSMKPIEDQLSVVHQYLMDELKKQENSAQDKDKSYKFDPHKFWKCEEIKKLENVIQKVFGFRAVQVLPYIEKYSSVDKQFESKEINCMCYTLDRYPIDGLVTDNGFFDKTHSIFLDIRISLGLIKLMEADELTAIILHEIGHNIDPAMVSITYAQTNILSKYLTDRSSELNKSEKKLIGRMKSGKTGKSLVLTPILTAILIITGVSATLGVAVSAIYAFITRMSNKNKHSKGDSSDTTRSDNIGGINKQMMNTLKKAIEEDSKTEFNRKDFMEAFADNFARMYGYGPQLTRGLKKISKSNENMINTRIKKEKVRQRCIMTMVYSGLTNVHKTEVHRVKALIASYNEDINDPNTPDVVKKQLEADVKEVEKVLDEYMNDFSDFQNNINRTISNEIDMAHNGDDVSVKPNDDVVKESTEIMYFDESAKAYKELMDRKNSVTSKERAEFYKTFGHSRACSLAKDKNGYYVYTHRCRSKSYPSISDIPEKDVEFVRSTS